jgi:CRP-like cAMP-binding protein
MGKLSINEISKLPFFYDLSLQEKEILSNYLIIREIEPNRYVFKEGDSPKGIYFILNGSVKVMKRTSPESEEFLGELASPNFFGEMALIDHRRKAASVITITQFRAAKLTCENFEIMAKKHPEIAINIIRKIAHTLSLKLRNISGNRDGII